VHALLAAELTAIRERGYRNGATGALCARLSDAAAEDVPRLLAAVEAALAMADTWDPLRGGTAAMSTEIRMAISAALAASGGDAPVWPQDGPRTAEQPPAGVTGYRAP